MNNQFPNGPDGGFLGLGNILRCRANIFEFLDDTAAGYGDIAYFQLGQHFIYLLNHPDYVRQVFSSDWQKFDKPAFLIASNRGHWGDGLTTLENKTWQQRRRLLQPAFHKRYFSAYARTIVDCTREMTATWDYDTSIDIDETMLLLVARIAARTLLDAELEGFGCAQQRSAIIPLNEALGEDFSLPQDGDEAGPIAMSRRRAGKNIETIIKIIRERFERHATDHADQPDRADMLSFLLQASYEDGSPMTEQEITDEIVQMFYAGHHSVVITLIRVCFALAQHPEVETKLLQELEHWSADNIESDPENLSALPYCDRVIKETMRHCMPTLFFFRQANQEVRIADYVLKKGASVWISPYLLHRDPRYFEQPERFWPERFSEQNVKNIPAYAYLPFGAGPRICIGNSFAMMMIRLVIATLMKSYRLIPASASTIVNNGFADIHPGKKTPMKVLPRYSMN